MEATYTYRANVLRIIDGDTYDVQVDVGFRMTATLPLRLAHVDTPERNTPEGVQAAQYVKDLLSPLPAPVVVRTYKPTDSFGRYLAEVWRGDVHLGDHLVDLGLGVPW